MEKIKALIPQNIKDLWISVPPILKKVLVITVCVLGVTLFLVMIASVGRLFKGGGGTTKKVTPQVSSSPTTILPPTLIPSRYATDSGVLKIEQDLTAIDKDLNTMKINQSELLPPTLDFDINFGE